MTENLGKTRLRHIRRWLRRPGSTAIATGLVATGALAIVVAIFGGQP